MHVLFVVAMVLAADEAPPALKASELVERCQAFEGKTVRVTGSIMSRTRCAPCTPKADCAPCPGESYAIATMPDASGPRQRIRVEGSAGDGLPDQPAVIEVEGTVHFRTGRPVGTCSVVRAQAHAVK
jgi:hypothetical protein